MKNMIISFVLICLAIAIAAPTHAAAEPASLSPEDFQFAFDGAIIKLQTPARPFIDMVESRMGKMNMIEYEASLFKGMNREYSNSEIVFATYPYGPDHTDMIESILIIGGDWTTARGIGIGASVDDVIEAYGTNFVMDYNEMRYHSSGGTPMIVFDLYLETNLVQSFFLINNTQVQ